VYTLNGVSLDLVAQNDDAGGAATSAVEFNAVGGTTYFIAVDGYRGATGNITLNWQRTVVPLGYSIGGAIKTSSGTPVSNVLVTLSGPKSASTLTNAAGHYSFGNLPQGQYSVQPSLSGYTFGPTGWNVSLGNADVLDADFLANQGLTVGGRVTDRAGFGLPGVQVTCKGKTGTLSAVTNAEGFYGFNNMLPWRLHGKSYQAAHEVQTRYLQGQSR
jgi:hypothetical protein